MGLSIKNAETEAAIRQLAALTGESLTDAVHESVVARLGRLGRRAVSADQRRAVRDAFFTELDSRKILDPRPWREIEAEMYDENGAPR